MLGQPAALKCTYLSGAGMGRLAKTKVMSMTESRVGLMKRMIKSVDKPVLRRAGQTYVFED